MRSPMFALALRQAAQVRRLLDAQEDAIRSIRVAQVTTAEAVRWGQGWKSRALALWLIADPDLRDGVVAALNDIDSFEEEKT